MPFVSKLWSHWPFWTSPSWKNAWRRLPVKLLRCLGSVYNPCSDHSFPFLWHSHAQWQVEQPGLQLQPWVMVGMDSSSGPHCVLYALQLITVSAQTFSEMFGTTKTVLAVCNAFLLHPQRAFVSDGTQLVDLTFRDDMPLTLTRADYQYIFVHPNMGRLLLVRSNVITWVELIENLSR